MKIFTQYSWHTVHFSHVLCSIYDVVPKSIHVCCICRIIIVLLVSWLVVYLMSALCDVPASQIMIIET